MIINKILDTDSVSPLHKMSSHSFMVETPALPNFIPAIVSTTRGKFITIRKFHPEQKIRSGVFECVEQKIDLILSDLFLSAKDLSKSEDFENIFSDPSEAYDHIKEASGLDFFPRTCLIPEKWDEDAIKGFFKNEYLSHSDDEDESTIKIRSLVYRETCKLVSCNVDFPVFLSRPDFVGVYYFFSGNLNSILLHNIEFGLAFCEI